MTGLFTATRITWRYGGSVVRSNAQNRSARAEEALQTAVHDLPCMKSCGIGSSLDHHRSASFSYSKIEARLAVPCLRESEAVNAAPDGLTRTAHHSVWDCIMILSDHRRVT